MVATKRGRWLGVTEPGVGANRLVWLDASSHALRFARTDIELEVDLSSRTLSVRRKDLPLRRMRVAVGRYGSNTPSGLFAVTDKLEGDAFSPVYGCCILALSAVQPNLPGGWRGGNRIAIHGTQRPGELGRAVSAGCLHAGASDLRYLMRVVPLGTPIHIRR